MDINALCEGVLRLAIDVVIIQSNSKNDLLELNRFMKFIIRIKAHVQESLEHYDL